MTDENSIPQPDAQPATASEPSPEPAQVPEAAPAPQSQTVIQNGGDDPAPVATPADFPDDWRQKIAKSYAGKDSGDDYEKELKRLERMSNPGDAYKSMRELEQKVSSGELKKSVEFPADGSDEDKAKWRTDNGIPDKPDGYLDSLDGLVVGDGDKPMVDSFLAHAHEKNMSPDAVKAGIEWYYETQEQQAADRAGKDAIFHDEAVETLRQEMGADYRRNINDLNTWLSKGPDGLADNLFGARLADGSLLGDNPQALSWLVSQMREINPLSTVVPNDGGDAMQSVENEIAEIQGLMKTDPNKYWSDQTKQKRLGELVAARDRQNQKAR